MPKMIHRISCYQKCQDRYLGLREAGEGWQEDNDDGHVVRAHAVGRFPQASIAERFADLLGGHALTYVPPDEVDHLQIGQQRLQPVSSCWYHPDMCVDRHN